MDCEVTKKKVMLKDAMKSEAALAALVTPAPEDFGSYEYLIPTNLLL